jgi:hypothetical protein
MTPGLPSMGRKIPLVLKVVYTLFVCFLVPIYWRDYGPANFLWFCDFGLLLTGIGLWLESPLLISMNAIALTLPQAVWAIDFLSGGHLLGISQYMFNSALPFLTRGLSTFHLWLPVLLLWLVWRVGYDRRAVLVQSGVLTALLIASYLLTDPRHPPGGYSNVAVNVNRVYGPAPTQVQTWMPGWLFLTILILFYLICVYLPTHFLFRRIFRPPDSMVSQPYASPAPQSAA